MADIKRQINYRIIDETAEKYINHHLTIILYDSVQDGILCNVFDIKDKILTFGNDAKISDMLEFLQMTHENKMRHIIAHRFYFCYSIPIYLVVQSDNNSIWCPTPYEVKKEYGTKLTITIAMPVAYICHFDFKHDNKNNLVIILKTLNVNYKLAPLLNNSDIYPNMMVSRRILTIDSLKKLMQNAIADVKLSANDDMFKTPILIKFHTAPQMLILYLIYLLVNDEKE